MAVTLDTPASAATDLPLQKDVSAADQDIATTDADSLKSRVKSAKDRRTSIDAPETKKRYATAHKQAFLSDNQISSHWVWRLFTFLIWPFNQFFHRLTFDTGAAEKLDPSKGFLSIAMHTTHNADIGFSITGTQKHFGRVIRGLVHRNVMLFNPWLAYMGMVPGYRDTAVQLLSQGYWVGVIPGGGEEAMRGHENAYNLDWPVKRRGFAKVAIRAGVPILPIFYQNCEEMRFNPVLWAWNKLHYGSQIYDYIVSLRIPYLSAMVKLVAESAWFMVATFFSIPMPAKVTAYVADPIEVNEDSDVDEVRQRAYAALRQLIKQHQPNGIDRWRAAKMWWQDRQREKQMKQKSKQL